MPLILLTLIFIRPFISSLAFPSTNMVYSYSLMLFLGLYIIGHGIDRQGLKPLKLPLIIFCISLVISVFFSQDRLNTINELYKYIIGILLLIVFASAVRETKLKIINIIIYAGFIISLLAIYQYFFGFRHLLEYMHQNNINSDFALDYLQPKRVFFPFVTADILGGYLIMILMLLLIDKKYTWLIFPILCALLLTKSLGAFLSLFLGLIVYFCLQDSAKRKQAVFLLGLLALTIVLIFVIRQITSREHAQPVFSILARINYWLGALRVIKAHPIAGVGLGNFSLAASRYAHNSYLQIWAEAGALGFISFLAVVFTIIKIGYARIKQAKDSAMLRGLMVALVMLLFHNFIDFTFFLPEVSFIWWVIAGLVISA